MQASVIIPTYNGGKKIGETLEALCQQSVSDFETIVVVDGSTDNTLEILQEFNNRLTNLIIVDQPNGGRASARNKGASVASCAILIFIDDDIELLPKNIESHIDFQLKNIETTLVGSPALNLQRIGDDAFLNFRASSEQSWIQKYERGFNKVTFNQFFFTTQNVSIPKNLFFEVGKFDDRLTDSEDFDLSVRLLQKGKSIFFNTELACYHNDFSDISLTILRQSQYYRSKLKLLELHPEYKSILPSQFEWLRKTGKDDFKKIIFKNRNLWEAFFRTTLFSCLPSALKNITFSSLIYTHTVLKVKK